MVIDVGINRVTLPDGTKKTVGDVDFGPVARSVPATSPPFPAAWADDGGDAPEEHAPQCGAAGAAKPMMTLYMRTQS